MRTRKPKGPKKVNYRIIDPKSDAGVRLYGFLKELRDAFHEDLAKARVALAWATGWKPDVDGRVTLGRLKRASDLDREFAAYDFVLLLNRQFIEDAGVSDAQRKALIDHELCHGAMKYDKTTGEPEVDERGRQMYRLRRHDLEEFAEIARRHGCWKRDLETFAVALRQSPQQALPLDEKKDGKAA
ncbi:hypothetical protein LLG88_13490 [bacterium]|nr:hypothetical protein [bacterium]